MEPRDGRPLGPGEPGTGSLDAAVTLRHPVPAAASNGGALRLRGADLRLEVRRRCAAAHLLGELDQLLRNRRGAVVVRHGAPVLAAAGLAQDGARLPFAGRAHWSQPAAGRASGPRWKTHRGTTPVCAGVEAAARAAGRIPGGLGPAPRGGGLLRT